MNIKNFLLKFLCTLLLSLFFISNGVAKKLSPQEHIALFQKGVDAFFLGQYGESSKYWLPLARIGDPMAARNIGILYHKGLGVRKDIEEAVLYYKIASDKGVTSAQLALGLLYLKGNHLARDFKKAKHYLQLSADAGDMISQYNLGLLYEHGLVGRKSKEQAWRYYYAAAASGHKKAAEKLIGKLPASNEYPQKKIEDLKKKQALKADDSQRPDHSRASFLTLETKKKIFETSQKISDPERIDFAPKLQEKNIPPLIFKEENKFKRIYSAKTPAPINPFDVTYKDKMTPDPQYGYTRILSLDEDTQDQSLVRAEKIYRYSMQRRKEARMLPISDQKKKEKLREAIQQEELALDIWFHLYSNKNSGEAAYRLGQFYLKKSKNKASPDRETLKQKAYLFFKKGDYWGDVKSKNALEALELTFSESDILQIENSIN